MEPLWSPGLRRVAISGKSDARGSGENKPKPLPWVATGCVRSSMVRRGSTVRVRQRASRKASNGLFCCLSGVSTTLERPSICPQDLSPTFQQPSSLGLSKGSDYMEHLLDREGFQRLRV